MVAALRPPPASPPALAPGRFAMFRFTRDEVSRMVRMGIVPEDSTTELLDGYLVYVDRAKTGDDYRPPMPAMFATRLPGPLGGLEVFRFTRDDVGRLVDVGIVPTGPIAELIDGYLVYTDRATAGEDVMGIGDAHALCVVLMYALSKQIDDDGRHVRSQQPLDCGLPYIPQPDFIILRGSARDHASTPTAADAFCIVEVADSSYERDTGAKLAAYARAGVVQYVVVDLRRRTAEVYENPDPAAGTYPPPRVVVADDTLELRVGDGGETFAVRLADVLP